MSYDCPIHEGMATCEGLRNGDGNGIDNRNRPISLESGEGTATLILAR